MSKPNPEGGPVQEDTMDGMKCEKCGRSFQTQQELDDHMTSEHGGDMGQGDVGQGDMAKGDMGRSDMDKGDTGQGE